MSEAFSQFDDELKLDKSENDGARSISKQMSESLTKAGLAISTFIQGSFGRKTMLPPLKDVDIVVMLAVRYRYLLHAADGPTQAMALLREVIAADFPGARFDEGDSPAKALRVSLPGCTFTFDLVVAFDSGGSSKRIVIGNRETEEWESSDTRILLDLVSERNVTTLGVWVRQARMFKSYRVDHPVLDDECGLLFESLLYDAITKRLPHAEALAAAIAHATKAAAGPIYDPTREDDLTAEWSPAHRARVVAAFAEASKLAQEALRLAAAGDEPAAIATWQRILGEPFPSAAPENVDEALRHWNGGSITQVGRVTPAVIPAAPSYRPSRAWRSH